MQLRQQILVLTDHFQNKNKTKACHFSGSHWLSREGTPEGTGFPLRRGCNPRPLLSPARSRVALPGGDTTLGGQQPHLSHLHAAGEGWARVCRALQHKTSRRGPWAASGLKGPGTSRSSRFKGTGKEAPGKPDLDGGPCTGVGKPRGRVRGLTRHEPSQPLRLGIAVGSFRRAEPIGAQYSTRERTPGAPQGSSARGRASRLRGLCAFTWEGDRVTEERAQAPGRRVPR